VRRVCWEHGRRVARSPICRFAPTSISRVRPVVEDREVGQRREHERPTSRSHRARPGDDDGEPPRWDGLPSGRGQTGDDRQPARGGRPDAHAWPDLGPRRARSPARSPATPPARRPAPPNVGDASRAAALQTPRRHPHQRPSGQPRSSRRRCLRGARRNSERMPRARCRLTAWGGVCSTSPSSVVITRIPVIAIAPIAPHAAPLSTSLTTGLRSSAERLDDPFSPSMRAAYSRAGVPQMCSGTLSCLLDLRRTLDTGGHPS